MDLGITKGDLVMVVKPSTCCNNGAALGSVLTVTGVDPRGVRCIHCGQTFDGPNALCSNGYGYLFVRLKRIPPISANESSACEAELPTPIALAG